MENSNPQDTIAIIFIYVLIILCAAAHEVNAEVVHHNLGDISEESVQPIAISTFLLAKGDTICININSRGGSVDAASFLSMMIEKAEAKVVAVVDGKASSAAAYLLTYADVRMIAYDAEIMIHRARDESGNLAPVGYNDMVDQFNIRSVIGFNEVLTKKDITKFWLGADVKLDKPEKYRKGYAEECLSK